MGVKVTIKYPYHSVGQVQRRQDMFTGQLLARIWEVRGISGYARNVKRGLILSSNMKRDFI